MRQWLAYAVTSALLHRLLEAHYADACRPSWWSLLDRSAYCAVVHRALQALSASPLLAAVALRGRHDLLGGGRAQ